jgi:hypothetical protein
MQYLYLIKCQQYYKIGVAADVEQRLAQLSTGNPFPLEVLAVYGFANAEPVEHAIHQRFANARVRGEWFELGENDVLAVKNICDLLGGQSANAGMPTLEEEDVEEAEIAQETANSGAKWDYAAMFADGWRMERQSAKGVNDRYWCWRRGGYGPGERQYIYGGRIADLPYPIEEMRRNYGGCNDKAEQGKDA